MKRIIIGLLSTICILSIIISGVMSFWPYIGYEIANPDDYEIAVSSDRKSMEISYDSMVDYETPGRRYTLYSDINADEPYVVITRDSFVMYRRKVFDVKDYDIIFAKDISGVTPGNRVVFNRYTHTISVNPNIYCVSDAVTFIAVCYFGIWAAIGVIYFIHGAGDLLTHLAYKFD